MRPAIRKVRRSQFNNRMHEVINPSEPQALEIAEMTDMLLNRPRAVHAIDQ
jgi:hypothetical protein